MFIPPPPEPEPSLRSENEAAYAYAEQLVKSGSTSEVALQKLLEAGVDKKTAQLILCELADSYSGEPTSSGVPPSANSIAEFEKKAIREAGKRNMAIGVLWFVGALAVTGATYMLARGQGGGPYLVAVGAFAVGVFQFARGVSQSTVE